MKTKEQARLQARVDPETRKALKLYCVHNDVTIEQAIELAVQMLCKTKTKKNEVINDK